VTLGPRAWFPNDHPDWPFIGEADMSKVMVDMASTSFPWMRRVSEVHRTVSGVATSFLISNGRNVWLEVET
jgi:hypothetical protein